MSTRPRTPWPLVPVPKRGEGSHGKIEVFLVLDQATATVDPGDGALDYPKRALHYWAVFVIPVR